MMVYRLLIWLLFLPAILKAQEASFQFSSHIEGAFSDFFVDNLGNIILLNEHGQLKKISPSGDSIAVFNNVRKYGKVHSVDVSNPLKILLYFKDFSTIVVLDRFLNSRAVIDLRKNALYQVGTIAQSYDNNIWVYDDQEAKLKRIGEDGRVIDQSTDLRLIMDSIPYPQHMVDQDKQLYLYDPLMGVYIFDYYGAIKRRLPFTGWKDFSVINQSLFGRDDKYLYRYEPGSFKLQQYLLPATFKDSKKIVIGQGKIYQLTGTGITIFDY